MVAERCHAHDYDDPGNPQIAWDDSEARAVLVDALVRDALALLAGVSGFDLDDDAAGTVALLTLIAGQDVEPAEGSDGTDGRRQIARKVAPTVNHHCSASSVNRKLAALTSFCKFHARRGVRHAGLLTTLAP